MLDWDPSGKIGPKNPLPDMITVLEPKEEQAITEPISEDFQKPAAPVATEESAAPAQEPIEA
ncbi:40S ribosomal protein S3 [Basidiobolus ranarum]|uniref:40S ribosomal protein S3 n=1 Tax=Basidiobolus ranarum TaxID=34480 RepID=A0ABR2WVY6_9FUNG